MLVKRDNLQIHSDDLITIAEHAADTILKYYKTEVDVSIKENDTPVTQADLASNEVVLNGLRELTPNIPILSEEALVPWQERKNWTQYWLVDPLDGTKEFLHQTDDFVINIALIEQGIATIGLIYAPIYKSCYFAAQGQGAFKQDQQGITDLTTVSRASVDPVRVLTSRSHISPKLQGWLDALGGYEQLKRGSALKFGLLAEGKADMYCRFGPTSEWDTASGQCILEELGGAVLTHDKQRLMYQYAENALNPAFIAYAPPKNKSLIKY